MKKHSHNSYVTAIDIGTTKICVLIATINDKGQLDILGIGQHASYGLKKGVIVDINTTVDSIKKAVKQAEEMACFTIETAYVGISGSHIKSLNSTGVVAIRGRDVTQHDIDRVIEAAKAIPLSADQDILHIIPQYFRVDGQEYVLDSLGMYGVRLEAQIHIVTGAIASARNIIKSCELAGIRVNDIVLEQIASAQAVLTQAERTTGVGLIDIGGGTSDFAIYKNGRITHSKVLPIAGNHFTNDISIGLHIPLDCAEDLKRRYGSVCQERIKELLGCYVDIDLGYQGGVQPVNLKNMCEILHFRAEELFDLFADEIFQHKLQYFMPCGMVLTGGGSMLNDIKKVANERLGMPTRIGLPETTAHEHGSAIPDILKNPIYATGYGLLMYAQEQMHKKEIISSEIGLFPLLVKKMKSWIGDFF